MLTIQPEDHAMEHIRERASKLLLSNEIRLMELLESIQYGFAYLITGFSFGVGLDYAMPHYNENIKTGPLFLEILIQSLLMIIGTFYLRKLVKIMPFLFTVSFGGAKAKYIPYQSEEYGGEVMIALVFLGAQFNFIKKLDLLSRRFYRWLYDEEKAVGSSLGI